MGNEARRKEKQMKSADAMIEEKHAAAPHMNEETHAYYWGRNTTWSAIADGQSKIKNPFVNQSMRLGFARGVKDALAEERINLDCEWD